MDGYFQFLCDIVGRGPNYNLLLKHLHRIEFYSLVPNDDNRGEDGKKLREIFLNEVARKGSSYVPRGSGKTWLDANKLLGPCTVLEMLLGLAYRMENELEGGPSPLKAFECFWIFLINLDLDWCDNTQYFENSSAEIIDEKIGILLDRKYRRDGVNGLFPLRKTKNDQRKVEIWYQMAEYLLENYEF